MSRILSKCEWLEDNYFVELDRTDEEKEEDYQCYVERVSIESIMFPDPDDDYYTDN